MKSLQVLAHIVKSEQEYYSDLQVMRSAAGWYIGTIYRNNHDQGPGSRDTGYFDTEEDAKFALQIMERINNNKKWVELSECSVMEHIDYAFQLTGIDPRRVGYRINP